MKPEEMYEVFAVANIVGGTIVIPHTSGGMDTGKSYCTLKYFKSTNQYSTFNVQRCVAG